MMYSCMMTRIHITDFFSENLILYCVYLDSSSPMKEDYIYTVIYRYKQIDKMIQS